jgi:hydrogenase expression/formation protein HypC
MCLALPGRLLSIYDDGGLTMGEVEFSGVTKNICLAYTPEAKVGEYVIVHVGFAITILNESEALMTLDLIHRALA